MDAKQFMPKKRFTRSDVEQLLTLSLLNQPDAATLLKQVLTGLIARKPASVAITKAWHDALLFIHAYPCNKTILHLAEQGLIHTSNHVASIMNNGRDNDRRSLSGTGIAGSMITSQFSFPITKWLLQKFPADVSMDSAAGNAEAGGTVLHRLFPRIEYYYTTQGNISLTKRIESLTGKQQVLQKLISTFEERIPDEHLQDIHFDSMQVFTSWRLDHPVFNRSFIRGISLPVFYHRKIIKQVDLAAVLKKPLPERIKLSHQQCIYLMDVAKASLAFYSRETEPITLAGASAVQLFSCGRGLAIALFGIKAERRLSLESYIGYMVFKNNIPVAYGGGWLFGDRCKIGLNVYPPFRKGESAVLFAEVLRLYHRLYNVQRFVVKPYQFGKGNKEGLQSAAFWFYYKLGFRPQKEAIAALAEAEYKSGRRSTMKLLKQFTGSSLELSLNPLLPGDMDPEHISAMITKMILNKFNGSRVLALKTCSSRLQKQLQVKDIPVHELLFNEFSLLCNLVPDLDKWEPAEKKKLLMLLKAKTQGDEAYIKQVQCCRNLVWGIYKALRKL